MHIGLFGGSFNPPHLGHLLIAEHMREQFELDQVWWMPAYRPPHKTEVDLASVADRLEMTRLAVEGNPAFVVSDAEVRREGTSYTVETLRTLQADHPEHDFSLLLGGDSFRDFSSWYRPDEILKRVPLLVYRRPGTTPPLVEPAQAGRVRWAEAPLLGISSTEIRARCRAGRSIRYLVPETVRRYIRAHRLYSL